MLIQHNSWNNTSILIFRKVHVILLIMNDNIHNEVFPAFLFDPVTLDLIDINNAGIEFYGYDRNEFIASKLFLIVPPEDLEKAKIRAAQPMPPNNYLSISRHMRKDKSVCEVRVFAKKVFVNGKSLTFVRVEPR